MVVWTLILCFAEHGLQEGTPTQEKKGEDPKIASPLDRQYVVN